MVSESIREKIMRIVNVFETGSPEGDYGALAIFADGKNNSRQITYGRSQSTEQGSLRPLIERYIDLDGAFAESFERYMTRLGKQPLVDDKAFKSLLKRAAEDYIMHVAQDDTFENLYFEPAWHFFKAEGFTLPLSLLVIYDSYIHSGSIPGFLRARFPERTPLRGGDEKAWITAYVNARNSWLANHTKAVLRPTVYRTQTFLQEIRKDNWDLSKPVKANGVMVE